jgi:hypothetical protein
MFFVELNLVPNNKRLCNIEYIQPPKYLSVQTVKDMDTPKIIAISNRDASNAQTWQTNATERKEWVMSGVCSVLEIFLRFTRDAQSTRTYKRKHTHLCVWKYTLLLYKSNKPYIQPGVTYAEMTKQNSYAATNIEQEPHINQLYQQTCDIRGLRNVIKSLSEQMGTMLNLLTAVLTELK